MTDQILPEQVTTPAEAQNTETVTELTIPKSRFDEVNNRLKALLAEQETAKAEREAREKAELEKRQEYQTLYQQAEAVATQAKAQLDQLHADYQAAQVALTALWDSKKHLVPPAFMEVVEALPLAKRLEWLGKNEAELSRPKQGTPQPPVLNGNGAKSYDFGNMPKARL
jgi:murein L,D-transpeptidase YcbB/YkuD